MKKLMSCALTGVIACMCAAGSAVAYEPKKDWPCVQVKVPDLSPGMMWTGPVLEGTHADYKASPAAMQMARKLVVRRYTDEQVAGFVKEYADSLDPASKEVELTRLFAAAFDLISTERKQVIAAIERFTRRQRQMADSVRKIREELDESLRIADPDEQQMVARREIEERLAWQTRIFDDREKSTKYVCEVPTLLEQRLFQIGRDVAEHLPQN